MGKGQLPSQQWGLHLSFQFSCHLETLVQVLSGGFFHPEFVRHVVKISAEQFLGARLSDTDMETCRSGLREFVRRFGGCCFKPVPRLWPGTAVNHSFRTSDALLPPLTTLLIPQWPPGTVQGCRCVTGAVLHPGAAGGVTPGWLLPLRVSAQLEPLAVSDRTGRGHPPSLNADPPAYKDLSYRDHSACTMRRGHRSVTPAW